MMRTLAALLLVALFPLPLVAQPPPIRLTLADAIARGFDTSHRLAEVRAREQGALAAVRGAHLADRPIVTASAGYLRTNHVTEFAFGQGSARTVVYPDIPDNVVSRVSFQWPIYTSGRVDALERAAAAEAQAVGADIETTRADLRLEIVRAYWAAATAREAVRVLEESTARADAQLRDARQRFAVGLVPPNEVSSLEAQRSREQAQLIEASNIRESTLVDLRRLIGADPETVIELADLLDQAGASSASGASGAGALVQEALERRPERVVLAVLVEERPEHQPQREAARGNHRRDRDRVNRGARQLATECEVDQRADQGQQRDPDEDRKTGELDVEVHGQCLNVVSRSTSTLRLPRNTATTIASPTAASAAATAITIKAKV